MYLPLLFLCYLLSFLPFHDGAAYGRWGAHGATQVKIRLLHPLSRRGQISLLLAVAESLHSGITPNLPYQHS